jgi:hypothetical protein
MNAQMIEVVAKAMAQAELWDGESLETAIGFVVDEGADIVLVPAAKAAIAAVFQEIRELAEAVTDAYAQDECGQAIVAALKALEKQP